LPIRPFSQDLRASRFGGEAASQACPEPVEGSAQDRVCLDGQSDTMEEVIRSESFAVSRNLYFLAASLLLFALISCGMALLPSVSQPGLPGNGSLWKTTGLFLFLGSLVSAFWAGLTAMFEQVERRNEERRSQRQHKDRGGKDV
jgi:hypothetical protein